MSYLNCSLNFTFSSPPPQQPHSPFFPLKFLKRNLRSVGGVTGPLGAAGVDIPAAAWFPSPGQFLIRSRLLKMELGFTMFILHNFSLEVHYLLL